MQQISEIARSMGLEDSSVFPYGHYKAKVSLDAIKNGDRRGKLVLVTGMTPTPAGEGKTTVSIGLTQALGRLGRRAAATLREPSLGPIFGIKGGGTGGGAARVVPEDEINVHFTGDAHAVASAHNLLSALTDNAAQRGQLPGFRAANITWRRVVDMEVQRTKGLFRLFARFGVTHFDGCDQISYGGADVAVCLELFLPQRPIKFQEIACIGRLTITLAFFEVLPNTNRNGGGGDDRRDHADYEFPCVVRNHQGNSVKSIGHDYS